MDKISIITVTFNAEDVLERTLQNIFQQTYPNLEIILIDGKSTDNTLKIIKKYENKIDFWLSEPDKGIYDAMNKGIQKVTGDWVNFMNAGDIFVSKQAIEKTFQNVPKNTDVVYGNYQISYQTFQKFKKVPADLQKFCQGMSLNHQSIFIKKAIIQDFLFNLKYSLAGDYEQLCRLIQANKKFHYSDVMIADFADGGASATQKIRYLKQVQEISTQFFPEFTENEEHFRQLIQQTQRLEKLKSILPVSIFEGLMYLKNQFKK